MGMMIIPGPQIFAVWEHVTSDINCWCQPALMQACPDCYGHPAPWCTTCGGTGVVPEYDPDKPYIVLHNPQRFEPRLT